MNTNNLVNREDQLPQYITQAPWYYNKANKSTSIVSSNIKGGNETGNATNLTGLIHQMRSQEETLPITDYTKRGFTAVAASKFRKGACENCGAMTHTKKDCFERPRKKGAKWTNKDIRNDEIILEQELDFEGKHDRWNGYNPDEYTAKFLEYEYIEKMKEKEKKLENKPDQPKDEEDQDIEDSKDEDEDEDLGEKEVIDSNKFYNALTRPLSKSNNTAEDYKNYMLHLNTTEGGAYETSNVKLTEETAQMKPESRSRMTGDAIKFLQAEEFIKKANEENKELNLNLVAAPTQGELFQKYFLEKKKNIIDEKRKLIIEKYGGQKHYDIPDDIKKPLSNKYVEYSETGVVLNKPKEEIKTISKANVVRGHISAFGSYYNKLLGWGYKCCYSFDYLSYCKGEKEKSLNKKLIEEKEAEHRKEMLNKKRQAS